MSEPANTDIERLQAEVDELRAEIAQLRALLRADAPEESEQPTVPAVTSRRRLLAMAGGAAAAGVVAAASSGVRPAAAASGQPILIDQSNAPSSGPALGTELDYQAATLRSDTNLFLVHELGTRQWGSSEFPAAVAGWATSSVVAGVYGYSANGGTSSVGVVGWSDGETGGIGVAAVATGTSGAGLSAAAAKGGDAVRAVATGAGSVGLRSQGERLDISAEGSGRVHLRAHTDAMPPASGPYAQGEIITDASGDLWMCAVAGTPGTWRKVGGATTAGAFHAIVPARVYDSRLPNAGGPLATNTNRLVNVADAVDPGTGAVRQAGVVPAGATAIAYNLTITDCVGSGFLSVVPGGAGAFSTSTINWAPGIPVAANGTVVAVAPDRTVRVFCGGGGSTQFIIDVVGYHR